MLSTSQVLSVATRVRSLGTSGVQTPQTLQVTNCRSSVRLVSTMTLMAALCLAVFSPAGAKAQNINTVAGGGNPGGAATSADIPGVTSLIRDASGNLYIAAPESFYIYKVNTAGTLSVFAGVGYQGYLGDGGLATNATLSGPASLAFDSAGDLYFIDLNKVRKINTSGNISTVAGNGQVCAGGQHACGDGGPATQAQLKQPQQIALDSAGNLYIADTGDQRIRLVDSTGNINTIIGTGVICNGPTFACGDGGPATMARLDLPAGIAVDASGNIYISDTRDQRLRVVTNGTINKFAGTGKHCPKPTSNCGDGGPALNANVFNPWGLALDANGNVFIADSSDNRIRKVTVSTGTINTVIGSGVQGFSGDGGPPRSAALDQPKGVFADNIGYVVADTGNNRVRQTRQAILNTLAGGGSGGDGAAATSALLASPNAVAWDAAGNYYIADTANNRVRKVDGAGTITTIAGSGDLGWTGDGGPATSATLDAPSGVAVDASNNVYIADLGNLVIRKVDASGTITTFAGSGNPCVITTNPCGDGGPATLANMTSPTSVAVDSKGSVYIADYFDHRIRKVDTTGTITTVAGSGVRGFKGDHGPATSARLNRPYGVSVDGSANVYIADSGNNRIRCVLVAKRGCGGSKAPVGDIVTFAFNGQATFAGDGGTARLASQQNPLEVALDPTGNVFVTGGADEVVRRIDAVTLIVSTVAGDPTHPLRGGFGGDGGPATDATLDNIGLAVNGSEVLLIADTGNNRIRQVDLGAKK
jgi:NHL repeat